MNERADVEPQNEIERVIAEMGLPNLQVILACYRRFADTVDYRKLMAWQITQPLDDLLQPLFLKAVITACRDLDLGDAARALAQMDDGCWEWAVQFEIARGAQLIQSPGEDDARELVASAAPGSGARCAVMRRWVGPWTEAPGSDGGFDSTD